jgi:hypothetical protein
MRTSSSSRQVELRGDLDRDSADRAIGVWFTALRPLLTAASVDLYSDRPWPPEVVPVLDRAYECSRRQGAVKSSRRRDLGMDVDLDPKDDAEFAMLLALAHLSIHAQGNIGDRLAVVAHDCGVSVWGDLQPGEVEIVRCALEVAGISAAWIVASDSRSE